jgi:hypothetical protein
MALEEHDTMVPSHVWANIGNDTAKWDDGWFSDTVHARRFEGDLVEIDSVVTSELHLGDNEKAYFGDVNDASIYYDGVDLIVKAREVGSGDVILEDCGLGVGQTGSSLGGLIDATFVTQATGSNQIGIYSAVFYGAASSGNFTNVVYGIYGNAQTVAAYDDDITTLQGFRNVSIHNGSGTCTYMYGSGFRVYAADGCGPVTNMYGNHIFCNAGATAGTVTNIYGLYIEDIDDGSTLNYSIYTKAGDVRLGGDTYFEGSGSGMPYGGISATDVASTITISGTGTANKVQVTAFNANDPSNLTTPNHTTDDITIIKTGVYRVTCFISSESVGGLGYKVGYGIWKNNGATQLTNLHSHRDFATGAGGEHGSVALGGHVSLTVGDTIELWVWNDTNTANVIIDDVTLSLEMVGG